MENLNLDTPTSPKSYLLEVKNDNDIPSFLKLLKSSKRISIQGISCAGKTTLAKQISEIKSFPFIELDALFWKPNWTESTDEEFFPKITQATLGDTWVINGNYTRTRHLYWNKLNLIILLDPPLWTILKRFFQRSLKRSLTKELLWNGCRENLKNSIFQKNSLLAWILKTYPKWQEKQESMLKNPSLSHIKFVRFQSPRIVQNSLKALEKSKVQS